MRPPNIIFIMADDLGYGDLGCFGGNHIHTPHIDSLAAHGLTFTDYHSNGAVCSPTRAALITGRYQQRCGLEGVIVVRGPTRQTGLPSTENSIAKALKPAGYTSGIFGKWHLGYRTEFNPIHHGFDRFRGYVSGNVDYHSHVDNAGYADWWEGLEQIQEKGYLTDLVSKHAVQFIRDNAHQPFFCYVAHEAPHWPYQGRHDPPDRVPGKENHPPRGSRQDQKAAYKEMIEAMDDGVGDILATLRELDIAENTLLIFCSDNGPEAVGSAGPLRGGKCSLFEGGHRVPAIAWWPGTIKPATTTDACAIGMDWLPTFSAIAGQNQPQVPDPLDGIDLSQLILHHQPLPDRPTFFRSGKLAAMRHGKWKFVRESDGTIHLFDLQADLGETNNLLNTHPDRALEMADTFATWEQEVTAGVTLQTGGTPHTP